MRQLIRPFRTSSKAGQVGARPSTRFRPSCGALEDRCLLSVSLSGSEPAGHLVGAPVTWTAAASGHGNAPVYQFRVSENGGAFALVRDFSTGNSLVWNPLREDSFVIQVTVKDTQSAAGGESATASYTASSRVSGSSAVVSSTTNPLVALYSAAPSSASSMYVQFVAQGSTGAWSSTSSQPIVPGKSTNFLIAGMLPSTTYLMREVRNDGTFSATSTFTTGPLPSSLVFPSMTVQQAAGTRTDLARNLVLHIGVNPPDGTVNTLATDSQGRVVWYFDPVANHFSSYAPSLVTGGTVLLLGGEQNGFGGATGLREVDLEGHTVRETNIGAVNAQLAALGLPSITDFNHDALRLPDGSTAVLSTTPRTVPLNGTPTEYRGDMVLVLDPDFQVKWAWDPFAWLDTDRLGTLGEGPGDWTHANSLSWSPVDGNLIVSMRSLDWVIKIDYANGQGDGHVVWRLGAGGDFSIRSSSPSPWFSHQHDVRYINNNTLVLFDNSNIRHTLNAAANSRGQVLVLDENTMQARLVFNADLGVYASAVGSAQMLSNGNLVFNAGFTEQTIEVRRSGGLVYVLKMNMPGIQYRSYIYPNLYGAPAGPASSANASQLARRIALRQQRLQRLAELRQRRAALQPLSQVHLARAISLPSRDRATT